MKRISLLIIGILIFIVLIFFKLDFTGFVHIVTVRLSWTFYAIIAFLICIQLVFRSIRFRLLFNSVFEYKMPLLKAFLLTSASFFVGLATPIKLGNIARGFFVIEKGLEITAICFIEYLLDILIVLAVPVLGIVFLYHYYLLEIVIAYLFLALVLLVIYIILRYSRIKDIFLRTQLYRKYNEKIELLKLYFKEGLKNKIILLIGVFYTCLAYSVNFAIHYAVLQKLGAGTTALETVIAAGTGVLLGSITFIPMGLGTRDTSIYGVLTVLGTDPDLALSSVIIMRSLSLPVVLVSGLCYFLTVRRIKI